MMHSSPIPLTVALDIIKRLQHELAGQLTAEQQRDFNRVEHLITDAQRSNKAALHKALIHAAQHSPAHEKARKAASGR